jgi:hypothetical protein
LTMPNSFELRSHKHVAAQFLWTPVTGFQQLPLVGKPNCSAAGTFNLSHMSEAARYLRSRFKLSQGNLNGFTCGGLYEAPRGNLICIEGALSEPPGMFEK